MEGASGDELITGPESLSQEEKAKIKPIETVRIDSSLIVLKFGVWIKLVTRVLGQIRIGIDIRRRNRIELEML